MSLLQEISSRGLTVNAHVYGSAVHACVVGKEPRRALALLEEMIERGVVPDAVVFTAAMTAVDGWAAALRLLEVMKRAVSDFLFFFFQCSEGSHRWAVCRCPPPFFCRGRLATSSLCKLCEACSAKRYRNNLRCCELLLSFWSERLYTHKRSGTPASFPTRPSRVYSGCVT